MQRFFVHGFTGSAADWSDIATAADICVTLPGHAFTPVHIKNFDDATRWLISQFPANEIHLIGYSLGARLALSCLHDDRVKKATLISVHPGLTSDAERKARAEHDAYWVELLEQNHIETFAREWIAQPVLKPVRSVKRSLPLQHDPLALAQCLRATSLAVMPDVSEKFLQKPVQLMCGKHDKKFLDLTKNLAYSRLDVIAECGHNPILEAPSELAVLLNQFDADNFD